MKKSKPVFQLLFIPFCLFFLGTSLVFGQENVEPLPEFKFTVKNSEEEIKMTCQEGCAWTTLTFKVNKSQAINQYGMTSINQKAPEEASDLANFLFTIERTAEGFELRGIDGTAWTHLTFEMKGKHSQSVDQMGMVSSE